jgi:esterase/lipase superfamily enzyme
MRLGQATARIGDDDADWGKTQERMLSATRGDQLVIELIDAEEFGILHASIPFLKVASETGEADQASTRFAAAINEKLRRSSKKDIYVYVHGIRVNFENPLLIASEFSQYLGRDGAWVAVSWPTTTKSWLAYLVDVEAAASSVRNLRILLAFLAAETDVDQIHILSYSAGSRVVSHALNELRLVHYNDDNSTLEEKLKIGKVILVGPDIDLTVFRAHYNDRIFDIPDQIIIYISRKDNVLKRARRIFREARLGDDLGFTESELKHLETTEFTVVIDVTDAEQATAENGHRYFRNSPWITSDILMTLKFGLKPGERGLMRDEGEAFWKFPKDYVERLKESVAPLYSVE